MRSICKNCKDKDKCGYIKRGKESDCIDVQTYDEGYEDAVEKAKKAFKQIITTMYDEFVIGSKTFDASMELFNKAMEE